MKIKTVAFIYPSRSTFVQKDIHILNEFATVLTPELNWLKKSSLFSNLFKQFAFLWQNRKMIDAIFVMFAGYWSFFPSLFGKLFSIKTYIIIGGTDAVYFSNLKYGNLGRPVLSWVIKKTFQWATKLLPVQETLIKSSYSYDQREPKSEQGVLAFFPTCKTSFEVIHNGFDGNYFNFNKIQKKRNHFVSIASIQTKKTLELKGFDLIIKTANSFPNYQFTLIGLSDTIKANLGEIPKNISIFPFLAHSELLKYLQESEFYFQLSISEGFPNALAEAMLCGCIPIVSDVSSLPDIVGKSGFILKKRDENDLKNLIDLASNNSDLENDKLSSEARNRILSEYSISKRAESFRNLLLD